MENNLHNLSYLAGLIDGEGTVGWHSCGRKQRPRFVIEIKMTCEPIIDWLINTYGGIKTYHLPKNIHHLPQFRWKVQYKKALELYSEVKPLLKLKGDVIIYVPQLRKP